ncbi:MAG TPA: hypothetical protein VE817_07840, partial [Candidatus Acidoferrum sp.]|nr:hypothetical protein [Candidatus Acidoferrum sp.]
MRLSAWTALTAAARPELPGPNVHPIRRTLRYILARGASTLVAHSLLRIELQGRERLPAGQYVLCFSHAN